MDKSYSKYLIVDLFNETTKIIEPLIHSYTRISNIKLQKILDYALKPKGDRERPLLVRLSCEAVGGEFINILPAAVSIELLHFSTLIIDDILDDSPMRGGMSTVYKKYGLKYAIIIGELINSLSFLALKSLYSDDNKINQVLKVVNNFKEVQKNVYYGQYLDLSFEHNEDITEAQYFNMISNTTGSLIKYCLLTGAMLGNGDKNEVYCLNKYGEELGKAFQVRDDIIEIIEAPKIIGKQTGGDIKQGKMRLPFIKALEFCNDSEKKILINVIKNKNIDDNEIKKTIDMIINCGAIEYCQEITGKYSLRAINHLNSLSNTPAKDALTDLAKIIGFLWE